MKITLNATHQVVPHPPPPYAGWGHTVYNSVSCCFTVSVTLMEVLRGYLVLQPLHVPPVAEHAWPVCHPYTHWDEDARTLLGLDRIMPLAAHLLDLCQLTPAGMDSSDRHLADPVSTLCPCRTGPTASYSSTTPLLGFLLPHQWFFPVYSAASSSDPLRNMGGSRLSPQNFSPSQEAPHTPVVLIPSIG